MARSESKFLFNIELFVYPREYFRFDDRLSDRSARSFSKSKIFLLDHFNASRWKVMINLSIRYCFFKGCRHRRSRMRLEQKFTNRSPFRASNVRAARALGTDDERSLQVLPLLQSARRCGSLRSLRQLFSNSG